MDKPSNTNILYLRMPQEQQFIFNEYSNAYYV